MASVEASEHDVEKRSPLAITLGYDAVAIVRERAVASGLTMGEAATAIILESVDARPRTGIPGTPPFLLPIRSDEPPVTEELVNRLRDELL